MDLTDLLDRFLNDRRLVRSPIWLFKHGLGGLFGGRFFLLEHTGRKSGQARHAVLECLERPDRRTVRAVAGLGRGSQWFRNVEADPRVRVRFGRAYVAATARILDVDEGRRALSHYRREHPRAAKTLFPLLEERCPSDKELHETIPVVEFLLDPR